MSDSIEDDGGGVRLRRLGILVVHNDPVPESEIWRAAPPGVEIITGRFSLQRAPGEEYLGESVEDFLSEPVRRTLADLADAGADALALCFASASVFGGPVFDAGFATLVQAATNVRAFTAGDAIRHRLSALNPSDPLLVAPPWFTDRTVAATKAYLELPPDTRTHRYDLGPAWDTDTRQDLFDRGAKGHIPHAALRDQILAAATPTTDAILIPGSGFRTLDAAAEVERKLGVPVVSANSAVLARGVEVAG